MERAVGGVEGIKHHAAGDLGISNFLKGMATMMSPNPMPLPTSAKLWWNPLAMCCNPLASIHSAYTG